MRSRRETTYGLLAEALGPGWSSGGRAIVQGLVIRHRIQIDLTRRITVRTIVVIHRVEGKNE